MSEPCWHCGVRPDVGCSHRPASPDWKPVEQPPEKRKVDATGRGWNFHKRKLPQYIKARMR